MCEKDLLCLLCLCLSLSLFGIVVLCLLVLVASWGFVIGERLETERAQEAAKAEKLKSRLDKWKEGYEAHSARHIVVFMKIILLNSEQKETEEAQEDAQRAQKDLEEERERTQKLKARLQAQKERADELQAQLEQARQAGPSKPKSSRTV